MCHELFQCENWWKIGWYNWLTALGCTEMRARVEKVDILGWNKSKIFQGIKSVEALRLSDLSNIILRIMWRTVLRDQTDKKIQKEQDGKKDHLDYTNNKLMLQQWFQLIKGVIISSWMMNCYSCANLGEVSLMNRFHQ